MTVCSAFKWQCRTHTSTTSESLRRKGDDDRDTESDTVATTTIDYNSVSSPYGRSRHEVPTHKFIPRYTHYTVHTAHRTTWSSPSANILFIYPRIVPFEFYYFTMRKLKNLATNETKKIIIIALQFDAQ